MIHNLSLPQLFLRKFSAVIAPLPRLVLGLGIAVAAVIFIPTAPTADLVARMPSSFTWIASAWAQGVSDPYANRYKGSQPPPGPSAPAGIPPARMSPGTPAPGVSAPGAQTPGVMVGPSPAPGSVVIDPSALPPVIGPRPAASRSGTTAAILLPLSGPTAPLGRALLDAAQMAVFETADERFILRPYDTQGTAQGAETAFLQAAQDGAGIVLGPLYGFEAAAIAPHVQATGINVISFSNDRRVAGNGVYIMGYLPRDQVRQTVEFAISKGLVRFAALVPQNDYGYAVLQALQEGAEASGLAQVVKIETYDPAVSDVSPAVQRLAAFRTKRQPGGVSDGGFQAVFLAEGGDRLRTVAPLLPFNDIDPSKVKFLGTILWDDEATGTEATLIGAWLAGPPRKEKSSFEMRYRAAFAIAPPGLAPLAYDVTALAAALAREGGNFTTAALEAESGFAGIGGLFRFSADGLIERAYSILEVLPRGLKVVKEAPTTFAAGPRPPLQNPSTMSVYPVPTSPVPGGANTPLQTMPVGPQGAGRPAPGMPPAGSAGVTPVTQEPLGNLPPSQPAPHSQPQPR